MRRIISLFALIALPAAAFPACGDSDSSGGGGSAGTAGSGGSGGGTGGTAGDSGADASFVDCFGEAGTFVSSDLKICDPTANECLFGAHQTDCCGTIQYVGLQKDQVAKFDQCEAEWRASLPACGCPAGLPSVEQAGTVQNESEVAVDCINCTASTCVCMTVPK